MSGRESRRFRAAAEGVGDSCNNVDASGEEQQRRRRSSSRSRIFGTSGRRPLTASSSASTETTGTASSAADRSTPRRQSSNMSLSHEDEIERIREMRARRLRNERLERDDVDEEEVTTLSTSNNSVRVSERRSMASSSSRPSSGRSILSTSSGSSPKRERGHHHHDGPPTRFRSNPSISRRELEEAGLLPSNASRGSSIATTSGSSSSGLVDTDNEIMSVSSYSKARRERMAAAAAAAVVASSSSSSRSVGTDARGTSRERDFRQRGDIEARLAARRQSRERMEASMRASTSSTTTETTTASSTGGAPPQSPKRPARQSSLSEVSQHSTSSRGSSVGSPYKQSQRRQRPSRSSTGDELQYSANRERLREVAKREAPNRARSAKEGGLVPTDEIRSDDERENGGYVDTLEARGISKKSDIPSQQPVRAQSASNVDGYPLESSPEERSSSTDLTTRLRERREARAAEREAREKERNALRSRSAADIHLPSTDKSGSAPHSPRKTPQLRDLELSDGSADDKTTSGWSIRLCVISAVDLPFNVLPNTPLCPVLKLGLVKLPQLSDVQSKGNENMTIAVLDKLGSKSIEAVETAKVRMTTSKILSKRDNGNIDFHQEYRWDRIQDPTSIGLCVELCARAVRTPTNFRESPPSLPDKNSAHSGNGSPLEGSRHDDRKSERATSLSRSSSGSNLAGPSTPTGSRGFWGRNSRRQAELEAAEAAAAVARMLIEQDGALDESHLPKSGDSDLSTSKGQQTNGTPGVEVTLASEYSNNKHCIEMTEDAQLGSLVIPLSDLQLDAAMKGSHTVRVERWYELYTQEEFLSTTIRRKRPSILLEISFASPEVFDDSEDEVEDDDETNPETLNSSAGSTIHNQSSYMRRAMLEARGRLKEEQKPQDEAKIEDPVLEPGVIDFIAVVGCGNIGNQKKDDGTKGWVQTTPDCRILEQFPPNNDVHSKNGRKALLPEMVQWFCFPEGARLWRGTAPPSHSELNFKRFSASSPPMVASSIAAFDACLNCTTSFSWFVIASNSDEYGSSLVKTYGAVIRFYVPAPAGVDPTQDDFAQAVMGKPLVPASSPNLKRLWVPIGICFTSSLPIIGVMEALLLQLCEELSTTTSNGVSSSRLEHLRKSLANIILNFQKPIAGAVNCAIPSLSSGRRFLLSLPPRTGLPPLPHGRAVISVCRLLGAEGLNFLIAAVLTECKVLIHSHDISDIAMVAEVVTALIYPFVWSLPYIPILPLGMLEFVEAPLSYILGIPSCNLPLVDPSALDDVVVIDLDNAYSPPEYLPGRRQPKGMSKQPNPLPVSVAANISKAVYKLLRAEAEIERDYGGADLDGINFPRMEVESLAEREFRVSLAIEICGLLRGYRECIGHVFNRDKFLKISPAMYEEKRESRLVGAGIGPKAGMPNAPQKIVSARSKRFLSNLVNGQNLQQLLESLESAEASFFHEVMDLIDESSSESKGPILSDPSDSKSTKSERIVAQLMKSLQQAEDKVPTYRVEKETGVYDENGDNFLFENGNVHDFDDFSGEIDIQSPEDRNFSSFSSTLLSPIKVDLPTSDSDEDIQAMSMEYLARIETTPWEYNSLFQVKDDGEAENDILVPIHEKVQLRDAIGERRFRAWKLAQDKKGGADADFTFISGTSSTSRQGTTLDLTSLVSSARSDTTDMYALSSGASSLRSSSLSPEEQRVVDAKGRDIIRRCLDKAQGGGSKANLDEPFKENGRDLMAEAEKALRNPSAQRFLLSILAQRSRLENTKSRSMRRQAAQGNATSRLDPLAFNCMVRLSCAVLDSCMEYKEYEIAYHLLTLTAGLVMIVEVDDDFEEEDPTKLIVTITSRVGLHPIFADIGVWETVMGLHLQERKSAKLSDVRSDEGSVDDDDDDEIEYEAAVATLYEMVGYGIPGEELSRFATRVSEENGWFCDDRGRQLLLLARRISIRRDQADSGATGEAGDIDMARRAPESEDRPESNFGWMDTDKEDDYKWIEVEWCHPAAPPSRSPIRSTESKLSSSLSSLDQYLKRSSVTALASFGSSVVVSGGLDGGVFMAYSIKSEINSESSPCVRGLHLDWGSASRAGAGSSSDGEYGVGAVCCLAAVSGGGQVHSATDATKDTTGGVDPFEFANLLEGSRVVAGTTAGDLRVWSVKEIYSSIMMSAKGERSDSGSSASRLKFSLRGRALSGHRGGVTCIDVPSQVYRPDSLITGGADGLIKLWSLRAPTGVKRVTDDTEGGTGPQRGRGGDALTTLEGHSGRILCVQTAWHGDHLLSGSSDRTICVWDLAASGGGKCIHKLSGHLGWITHTKYWGPNTIVSASTDRSVALWDARVRSTPLFMLRHHDSPISDLFVGGRTEPYMVTASAGGIATWDFRALSDSKGETTLSTTAGKVSAGSGKQIRSCTIVRQPSVALRPDGKEASARQKFPLGSVLLARGVKDPFNSFMSIGSDATLRTWETSSGKLLEDVPTGHCDAISNFFSFTHLPFAGSVQSDVGGDKRVVNRGTITSSWDGTIRMRRLVTSSLGDTDTGDDS